MNAYELAHISRRKALGLAGVFMVAAACSPEKLFGPCALPPSDEPPRDPGPEFRRSDVSITSRDATNSLQFDGVMRELLPTPNLAVHYDGRFKTAGVYRWGQYARRNLGDNWTVDGDAEISLDPASIVDVDSQPLYCLAGPARSVAQITTRGNHAVLAERWKGSLRTGAVLLESDGSIDGVGLHDFGSLGAETFVAEIVGSGSIINTVFADFAPSASDTQVTVRRIMGSENGESITPKLCLMEGNETYASGDNQVQAHTIYWATSGRIRNNRSRGARIGVYGDWGTTSGLEFDDNDFEGCEHGFQFRLAAGDFSHEDYRIGANRVVSWGKNVSLDTCGAPTSTRFIRNIDVHPSLSLEAFGAENVTRSACRLAA